MAPGTDNKSHFLTTFSNISRYLIGDYDNHTLENRVFNASAILTTTAAFGSLILNLFSGFDLLSNLIYLIFIVIFFGLYYLGRVKQIYKSFYFYIFGITAISFLWFINEGLNGTVPLVFTVSILLFTSLVKIQHHLFIYIITISVIILLVLAEKYFYDELIIRYADSETRELQLFFGLLLSVSVVFIFTHSLKKNFLRETEKIKQQEKELSNINATKEKLFSIISHDLKGHFNSILGFSELINAESEDASSENIRKYARMINHSADSAYKLLINLLNWSSLNQGDIPFNPKEVNLNSLVVDCVELLKEITNQKAITIKYDIDVNLFINADINMIQVILRNLFSNALKFTEKGGTITISSRVNPDQTVEVSVKDSGIGMSSDILENLFQMDSQIISEGTDGEYGTGLGLLLCKGFAEKHDGRIWAESEVGSGSTFYFTIPG